MSDFGKAYQNQRARAAIAAATQPME